MGIIRERKNSGLSVKSFCEKAGIQKSLYYYWQRKLREGACEELVKYQSRAVGLVSRDTLKAGTNDKIKLGRNSKQATRINPSDTDLATKRHDKVEWKQMAKLTREGFIAFMDESKTETKAGFLPWVA